MRIPGESEPSSIESGDETFAIQLRELGLEANRENIAAAQEMQRVPNLPRGYADIEDSLDDLERLRIAMEKAGITSITHSEGKTVWDHTRRCIHELEKLGLPADQNEELRLILLYHDLGKTEAIRFPWNISRTRERAEKGKLQVAMMGHPEARLDDINRSLASNGLAGERLDRAMTVIQNHMRTDLLIMNPVKIVPIIESFGADDGQRRETLNLLALVIKIDGLGTQYTTLAEGKLSVVHDVEKEHFEPEAVWKRYEEGKILAEQAKVEAELCAARAKREGEIFGSSLYDYLITRGFEKGPGMGLVMKRVRDIISKNPDAEPADIKKKIDKTELP
ncbi:MAG: hypothetical protein WC497_03645 [Patescibacteria group bacterium]